MISVHGVTGNATLPVVELPGVRLQIKLGTPVGLQGSAPPPALSPADWVGLEHVYGLADVSFAVLPDLVDACAQPLSGAVPPAEVISSAEHFVDCVLETDPDTGETRIIAQENVPGTFITFQNVRAGSGNVELFGNNVTGNASITARADSEILIENNSPMNVRVKDLIIDSSGGYGGLFAGKPALTSIGVGAGLPANRPENSIHN